MYKARVMWYVYGIEYPPKWKNSFIFIDNWIINIEESKLPTTVLRKKQLLQKVNDGYNMNEFDILDYTNVKSINII